jgi:trehalose/maltose hydrolase-like predicted phosphorylase
VARAFELLAAAVARRADDRTRAAVWWTLEDVAGHGDAHVPALVARVRDLLRAGVHVAVVADRPVREVDRCLGLRPDGPGALHLLTGGGTEVHRCGPDGVRREVCTGDDADAAAGVRWLARRMVADLGIGPGLVLVFGRTLAALVAGEPTLRRAAAAGADLGNADVAAAELGRLLDAQLRRRVERRVPDIDRDPAWVLRLPVPATPADIAVQETLCTLSDGRIGTRGWLEDRPSTAPTVHAAGVYTDHDDRRSLLSGPGWTALSGPPHPGGERLLDLRTGVLLRESDGGFRSLRFASCARPGVVALRAEADTQLDPGPALVPCDDGGPAACRTLVTSTRGGGIVAAAVQVVGTSVQRIAAYVAQPSRHPAPDAARRATDDAAHVGFDALVAEQRAAWAHRWADAAISIDGDDEAQLAARFALFHLLSVASDDGGAAVGARGTSGPAYDGHVFWDADVFVLPVLAAVRPAAARAMLRYRVDRVAAARRRAKALGHAGALWPWESTDDGDDVTPEVGRDRHGRPVPILTGAAEHHIVADVAWAAVHYARWTGDVGFLEGAGLPLVIDGARFWASRIETDQQGRAHIRGVIGPDEYHALVDDNAFTNVMARWHLRTAADLAERVRAAPPQEVATWRRLADAIVDGYDGHTGRYEQFAGFSALTPLRIADVATPPIAADLLLGREVVQASQVVKQADVVMLHHLLPDALPEGSLARDLAFYEPRTAHGSSLSPAIHAAAWARAGRPDLGLDLLRIALRLDLDDVTGTTAGGLHVATLGGVWQAIVHGFLGVRVDTREDALAVDPVLPGAWDAVEATVRFRGVRTVVRAEHDGVDVTCERPTPVGIAGRAPVTVGPDGCRTPLARRGRELP